MEIFQEFKKQFIKFLNSDNRIVLTKGKNIEILVNHIKDNPASKVFIITANDWEFNSKVSKTLEEMSDIVVGEDLKQGIHEIFNSGFNNGN